MSEAREVTCTTCPVGCRIRVTLEEGTPVSMTGNQCKRGVEYARAEVTDPRRVVTSTVWAVGANGRRVLLPVRTQAAVPKRLMFDIMRVLSKSEVSLPVQMGDIVRPDVLGTGIDIVASRTLN